jgi:hypothetical protein
LNPSPLIVILSLYFSHINKIQMPFHLTTTHVRSFLDPASAGDWKPFLVAIDPDVKWLMQIPSKTLP